MNLPEIVLDNVRFESETWDYASRSGIGVFVELDGEPVIRYGIGYRNYVIVTPPQYETREMVFEIKGPDGVPRYVTQEVEVLLDPGETRPLTPAELADRAAEAKAKLVDWLRHVALAGQLLIPTATDTRVASLIREQLRIARTLPQDGVFETRHLVNLLDEMLNALRVASGGERVAQTMEPAHE